MKGSKSKKAAAPESTIPGVDMVQVERVLAFMASHHLDEFEYSHGGLHIRLKRAAAGRASQPTQHMAEIAADAPHARAQTESVAAPGDGASQPPAKPVAPKEELHVIKSPIVGTFYSTPSPEAPPFVKVGDSIQSGQVVCIVEAMKLMNEIEADMGGEIVGVLAENGQPVEYGQSLFALRPAKKK